eukprot:346188-Pleurochrysis_carterae.AAC.2
MTESSSKRQLIRPPADNERRKQRIKAPTLPMEVVRGRPRAPPTACRRARPASASDSPWRAAAPRALRKRHPTKENGQKTTVGRAVSREIQARFRSARAGVCMFHIFRF